MNNTTPPSTIASTTDTQTATPNDATPKDLVAAVPEIADELNELKDLKEAVVDSAELATRAAGLAADAGGHLRKASQELMTSHLQQRKFLVVLLVACGSLMLVGGGVFGALAWRLQTRVNQLDEMVLAVGKRIVGMDASMESVGAVQDALKALLLKQETIAGMQVKIDGRLDEAIKSTLDMPELTAKQVDTKTQAMTQQVTAMEGRLKGQAGALSTLSTQMKGLQGALGDAGAVRRELEAQARQQRERLHADGQANTAAAAASAAAAAAVRQRESMLQYPRAQPADKP
jgi:hypothetical protein